MLELQGITKRFRGGVVANDDVSLNCRAGEVHAVLGQNGAGKSTLMKILGGHFSPDAGTIRLRGTPTHFSNPQKSMQAGIGIVHQHFSLVDELTVAENLFLNDPGLGSKFRPHKLYPQIHSAAERAGIQIDPSSRVGGLSEGEKQRIEILKVILHGAEILILDEPTSMLAPQEADMLFDHIRQFVRSGGLVLLVTHKVDHVFAVATHVTVLRSGRVVAQGGVEEFDPNRLITSMAGGDADVTTTTTSQEQLLQEGEFGERVLCVQDLSTPGRSGRCGLKGVDIDVRAHEVLGVAGLGGNGQEELVEAVLTWDSQRESISIKSTRHDTPRIGIAPGNRTLHGLASSLSIEENLLMRRYASSPFHRWGFLSWRNRARFSDECIASFSIRPGTRGASLRTLSGGNQQKVLLARELDFNPDILIAVHPTAGLDLRATQFTFEKIREAAREGCAVLLVSEDLDELLALSDRIAVLYKGDIVGNFPAEPSHHTRIGLAMNGIVEPLDAVPAEGVDSA